MTTGFEPPTSPPIRTTGGTTGGTTPGAGTTTAATVDRAELRAELRAEMEQLRHELESIRSIAARSYQHHHPLPEQSTTAPILLALGLGLAAIAATMALLDTNRQLRTYEGR